MGEKHKNICKELFVIIGKIPNSIIPKPSQPPSRDGPLYTGSLVSWEKCSISVFKTLYINLYKFHQKKVCSLWLYLDTEVGGGLHFLFSYVLLSFVSFSVRMMWVVKVFLPGTCSPHLRGRAGRKEKYYWQLMAQCWSSARWLDSSSSPSLPSSDCLSWQEKEMLNSLRLNFIKSIS